MFRNVVCEWMLGSLHSFFQDRSEEKCLRRVNKQTSEASTQQLSSIQLLTRTTSIKNKNTWQSNFTKVMTPLCLKWQLELKKNKGTTTIQASKRSYTNIWASVQKSAVLGTAKMLHRTFKLPLVEDPSLRMTQIPPHEGERDVFFNTFIYICLYILDITVVLQVKVSKSGGNQSKSRQVSRGLFSVISWDFVTLAFMSQQIFLLLVELKLILILLILDESADLFFHRSIDHLLF